MPSHTENPVMPRLCLIASAHITITISVCAKLFLLEAAVNNVITSPKSSSFILSASQTEVPVDFRN